MRGQSETSYFSRGDLTFFLNPGAVDRSTFPHCSRPAARTLRARNRRRFTAGPRTAGVQSHDSGRRSRINRQLRQIAHRAAHLSKVVSAACTAAPAIPRGGDSPASRRGRRAPASTAVAR